MGSDYREAGRLVARPTARATRDELVADWWLAARRGESDAVMIAHRRSDVADLNQRARALMAADGRLGDVTVEAAGRGFACGDRVLAKHNDRRAGIVNGARGDVIGVDDERRSVTVRLQTDKVVVLESAYLDEGNLDYGYALTAHAAQGTTVDRAFVLGSDDLYREWGYTALTRHREEARFYLVSPGSVERSLPGLERETDDLFEDLNEMLGDSRQKSLALDILDEDYSAEVLARYRAIVAREGRRTSELAAAEAARDQAEARLAALREERADVGPFQRRRRAEIDAEIAMNEAARDRWAGDAATRRERAEEAGYTRHTWLERNEAEVRGALATQLTFQARAGIDRTNALRDLVADQRSPARPDALAAREDWACEAIQLAEAELDSVGPEAPGPELDLPDFDLGP